MKNRMAAMKITLSTFIVYLFCIGELIVLVIF